jgi:CubicO group peptidase (beta-lactamase class C family)
MSSDKTPEKRGLFSNATDLASLMQMILNKGSYAGVRYINESVVIYENTINNVTKISSV